jgi:hypothetical protein
MFNKACLSFFGLFLLVNGLTFAEFDEINVCKKYLGPHEFMVSDKGIFVQIEGLPVQASTLHSDSRGLYVIVADIDGEWVCPRCSSTNDSGSVCSSCKWPLHDNDDP